MVSDDIGRGTAGTRLQHVRDELARLEGELAAAWPDPARVRGDLEAGERELLALRAEARLLDGARRFADCATVVAWSVAMALSLVTAWFLRGR